MLPQVRGLLYDKVVLKQIYVTDVDIADAYERRDMVMISKIHEMAVSQ
jgi:hypothetical protein